MLNSILLGILLAIATIVVHSIGTSSLIGFLQSKSEAFRNRVGEFKAFSLTAVCLLLIHITETMVWAFAYFFVVGSDHFPTFEDAVYFSTVTFSTLGYGDIVIEGRWRLLSACQAMTGLLVFGWSTALLFAVVQRVWGHKFGESDKP